jgi:hypothetical protein
MLFDRPNRRGHPGTGRRAGPKCRNHHHKAIGGGVPHLHPPRREDAPPLNGHQTFWNVTAMVPNLHPILHRHLIEQLPLLHYADHQNDDPGCE